MIISKPQSILQESTAILFAYQPTYPEIRQESIDTQAFKWRIFTIIIIIIIIMIIVII